MRTGYQFLLLISSFFFVSGFTWSSQVEETTSFNFKKDLLLMHFDCKTDVDDIHSAAALKMLMSDSCFSNVDYYAVAGTYGIQEGLYVPPNELFKLAFGDKWVDAHADREKAINKMKDVTLKCLLTGGNIWIAEAGQSDFSAELIKAIQKDAPTVNTSKQIHIVQHSNWNEEVTTPKASHL